MKIMPLLFFLFAIQLSLALYTLSDTYKNGNYGVYNDTNNTLFDPNYNYTNYNAGNFTTTGSSNVTGSQLFGGTDMWSIFFYPFEGNNAKLMLYILSFAVLIGAMGFIPFINRSDISMLSGPFIFMIGAGLPTVVTLYSFLQTQIGGMVCNPNQVCWIAQFMGVIICGPLAFAWFASCFEWLTGRPMS